MRKTKIAADRRRALKKAIRESDRALETVAANRRALVGEETVDIHVNVETLYNPLSMPDQRLLADEIYEFIEESTRLYAYLVPIRVVLHGVPEAERGAVPAIIKAHYETILQGQMWERRENTVNSVVMLVVGLLFLGVYMTLALTREDSLLLEVLSVIGSFALWETMDCFLLERRSIKRQMLETAQYLTMEVAFED